MILILGKTGFVAKKLSIICTDFLSHSISRDDLNYYDKIFCLSTFTRIKSNS